MTNWLCSRERVLAALSDVRSDQYPLIDDHIAAASKEIEKRFNRYFIPRAETRYYSWPQFLRDRVQDGLTLNVVLRYYKLQLDDAGGPVGLLSLTTLTTLNGTVTIAASDYFLEPANEPPYHTIEIDLGSATSSTSEFNWTDTPQRAIAVTGLWGYSQATKTAGTVTSGIAADAAAVSMVCSDASLVDVGDTLLIGTEQIFVSERATFDSTITLNDAAVTASAANQSITVSDGTKVHAGEVILLDSERMFIQSISGNVLSVIRAYQGTILAAHVTAIKVYVFRTLTIVRGVNGTTAAVHADASAISKYVVEDLIQKLARSQAIYSFRGDASGQSGQYGGASHEQTASPSGLGKLWAECEDIYCEPVFA